MHVQLGVILMDAGAYVLEKASKRNIRGRERKRFLTPVNCLAGRCELSDWLDGRIFDTYQEQGQQTGGLIGIFYYISIPKKYSYMYTTPVLYLCRRLGGPIYIYIYIWCAANCFSSNQSTYTKYTLLFHLRFLPA